LSCTVRQHRKPVVPSREAPRERGVDFGVGDLLRGVGIGERGPPLRVGQVLGQPLATLRLRDGMAADYLDVAKFSARPDEQRELNRDDDLGLDQQLRACGELVEGGVDAALDRALDRHHGLIGLARVHRVERCLDRRAGHGLELAIRMQRADGLFAECPARPEIRATIHFAHGAAAAVSASCCSATWPSGRAVACCHG
jgi:hypothetical protein